MYVDTDIEHMKLDMICRCSDEGAAEADALLADVKRRLDVKPDLVTDANFLTHIVISLNWDFDASITGIANDMWSMVSAETWLSSTKDKLRITVQCDEVEDGFAAIWKAYADRAGKYKEVNDEKKRSHLAGAPGGAPQSEETEDPAT